VTPQFHATLERLGLEAVDLLVFHNVSDTGTWQKLTASGGAMRELAECVAAGKARFKGISSHHPEVLLSALSSGTCDVVMFPIGPFVDPRYVNEILPLCRARGVGSVCLKTFGAGKLLGDTEGYGRLLSQRPRGKLSSGGSDENAPLLPRLSVEECVRCTLTLDPDVALLGMSFPNEQDAALSAAAAFQPMSGNELAQIRERARQAIAGKGEIWWDPK
jgi:1-deoxyxylulose-5-phosphate synthase